MSERITKVERVFNELRADNLDILDGFYTDDATFVDPLGAINGLPGLRAYYAAMYKNVQSIRFDFWKHLTNGDELVSFWNMTYRVKVFGDKDIVVPGNSLFRFRGDKVCEHRDTFDVGAMVYEHVPVLGFGVRALKKRLGH